MTQWLRNLFVRAPQPLWVTKIARQLSDRDGRVIDKGAMLPSGVKVTRWTCPNIIPELFITGNQGGVMLRPWNRDYHAICRPLKSWQRKYLSDLATSTRAATELMAKLLVTEIETG